MREYGRVLCLRVLPEFASVGLAELTRADIQGFWTGCSRTSWRQARSATRSILCRPSIDAGVNPKAIQEFMGHATIEETFSRYGHLMPGTRNQARELVDAYMAVAAA